VPDLRLEVQGPNDQANFEEHLQHNSSSQWHALLDFL